MQRRKKTVYFLVSCSNSVWISATKLNGFLLLSFCYKCYYINVYSSSVSNIIVSWCLSWLHFWHKLFIFCLFVPRVYSFTYPNTWRVVFFISVSSINISISTQIYQRNIYLYTYMCVYIYLYTMMCLASVYYVGYKSAIMNFSASVNVRKKKNFFNKFCQEKQKFAISWKFIDKKFRKRYDLTIHMHQIQKHSRNNVAEKLFHSLDHNIIRSLLLLCAVITYGKNAMILTRISHLFFIHIVCTHTDTQHQTDHIYAEQRCVHCQ